MLRRLAAGNPRPIGMVRTAPPHPSETSRQPSRPLVGRVLCGRYQFAYGAPPVIEFNRCSRELRFDPKDVLRTDEQSCLPAGVEGLKLHGCFNDLKR